MEQEIRTRYDAKKILASIPRDRGELFMGYRAVAETDRWTEQFRQTLEREPDRRVFRSVFEANADEKGGGGVVVEVAECSSAWDAVDDLMDTLAENQAAELPPGPEALRPAAFQHPEQAPPALFFARANLRISILAQSRNGDSVGRWLQRIRQDLDLSPEDAREGIQIRSRDQKKVQDDRRRLHYELPWKLGPDGWLKFIATGATLERGAEPGELILGPAEEEVTVRGWALEHGRESYMGEFRLSRP